MFQASSDGRAAVTRVNALIQKKQTENADKAKLLQANQQKLQTSGSVMNEGARVQLEKEIEKQQKDAERFQQDAQAEINELQQEVQNEFVKKLSPIVEQLATEKGLHLVFNASESGIAWAAPGLDLTQDVIKKLDALAKTGDRKITPRRAQGSGLRAALALSPQPYSCAEHPHPPRPPLLSAAIFSGGRNHRARRGAAAGRGEERHRQRGILPGPFSRRAASCPA